MNEGITWTMGSDSSEVRADMMKTVQVVEQGGNKMVATLNRADSAHENLLRSDHKVSGRLNRFTAELLQGEDAVHGLASALEGMAMATNVGLPALIGLELVSTLISKLAKAHEEAVKLDKDLDKAAAPRAADSKVPLREDAKSRMDVVDKAREDIKGREDKTPKWYNPMSWHWGAIGEAYNKMSWDSPEEQKRNQQMHADARSKDPNVAPEVDRSWGILMQLTKTTAELEKEKADQAERTAKAIEAQADAEERMIKSKTSLKDKLSFSIDELAKNGRMTAVGDDSRWGAGRAAKEVQKEEALAKKAALAEHPAEAMQHQMRAEEIKNSIAPLRDTEKDTLSALERSQVLRNIEINTARQFVNK